MLTLATACTNGDDSNDAGDGSSPDASGTPVAETTTTTEPPPIVRGLGETLGLVTGQCYDDVPETTTTTVATTVTTEGEDGSTTTAPPESTTEPTAPPTTRPRPPTIAVVDCNGTFKGIVFATFCIGSTVDPDVVVDEPRELGQVGCPGDAQLAWPGDRAIRRAAARLCLGFFENLYGESYALSEIGTHETA